MTTADTTTVRSWARENGFTTGDRGRLSQTILAAYAKAVTSKPNDRSATAAPKVKARAVTAPSKGPRKAATAKAVAPRTAKATAPKKASPAKKGSSTTTRSKPTKAMVPAAKSTAAKPVRRPVSKPVAASKASTSRPNKVPSGRPAARPTSTTTRAVRAAPAPVTSLAASIEVATGDRFVALELQVAALTSRLVALETARPVASNDGTSTAKPTRKFSRRG